MLFLIAGSLYISFLCFCWGSFVLKIIQRLSKEHGSTLPHISIICLAGLATITIFSSALSFVSPLGKWYIQASLFLFSIILFIWLKKNQRLNFSFKLHSSSSILTVLLLILLLVMASWKINHPDTLGYHAQIIEWIRNYKIIPGLAHLNSRLGLQSLWFPACALFDYNLPQSNTINLLNFTVTIWYVFFLVKKIDSSFEKKKSDGILWIALLMISLWSYTQIRLTVTSASPDFIVSILIWTIIYLLLQPLKIENLVLTTLFCFWAISIKLSSLPVILIGLNCLFLILRSKKIKAFFFSLFFGMLLLICFSARNSITTGYLFYPSTFPDVINVDWKINKQIADQQKKYITVYARTQVSYEGAKVKYFYDQKPAVWIPLWWTKLSVSDKLILSLFAFAFIVCMGFIKKITTQSFQHKILLAVLFSGTLFWFFLAPDPRFGNGFMIGFIILISQIVFSKFAASFTRKILSGLIFLTSFIVLGYLVYRIYFFFLPQQILFPLEIQKPITKTIVCNGIKIQLPVSEQLLEPTTDDCNTFNLRGKEITNGFRSVTSDY